MVTVGVLAGGLVVPLVARFGGTGLRDLLLGNGGRLAGIFAAASGVLWGYGRRAGGNDNPQRAELRVYGRDERR